VNLARHLRVERDQPADLAVAAGGGRIGASSASVSITRACAVITVSRAASSGIWGTNRHDHDILAVIEPTR
jgi:hypothetical protein